MKIYAGLQPILAQPGMSEEETFYRWLAEHPEAAVGASGAATCAGGFAGQIVSAGIAEAFVKTFRRDYARLSILTDAAAVITLMPAWFAFEKPRPDPQRTARRFQDQVSLLRKEPSKSSRADIQGCT